MSFPVFWLPFLVAHTAAISTDAVPAPAAPQFARAVRTLADAGYELRDLRTTPTEKGVEIGLVLANERRAEAISVVFDDEIKSFSGFTQRRVELLGEERHYLHGAELLEELSLSAPIALGYDCADFYLDFGSRSVSLAEQAFEVELRHTARRPGAALASWLRELLDDGSLVEVRDERWDDGATLSSEVVFVIDSSEGTQELRVAVDAEGHPLELSLVHSPSIEVYQRYEKASELRQALGARVESLNFVFGDETDPSEFDAVELELRLRSPNKTGAQASLHIALDAFADQPFEGCGC